MSIFPRILHETLYRGTIFIVFLCVIFPAGFGCRNSNNHEPFDLNRLLETSVPEILNTPDVAGFIQKETQLCRHIRNGPDQSGFHLQIGFIYLDIAHLANNKKVRKALEHEANNEFNLALKLDPGSLDALLGRNLSDRNLKPGNIIELYSAIANRFPDQFTKISGHSDDNQTKLKYEKLAFLYKRTKTISGINKAIRLTNEIMKRFPGDQKNLVDMARLHLSIGNLDQAEKFARKAIEIAEGSGNAFDVTVGKNILGYVFMTRKNYKEAERLFKEARYNEKGELWACAFQSLGILYSETGNSKLEAENEMVVADEYNKSGIFGYEAALANIKAGDYTNALKYIDQAIKLENKEAFLVVKGHILLALRKYLKAQKLFDEILTKNIRSPGAKVGLGHLCIIRKDFDCAMENFKPALGEENQLDPFVFEMAHLGMAWMSANQNKHREALLHYKKILSTRPNSILALIGKGNSLIGLFKMDEAEAALKKALELQPGNPYATAELAVIQMSRGNVEEAELAFKRTIAKDDSNYTCPYEGLGLLFLQQGEFEKARKNLKKAIEINPEIEYKKYNGLARIYIREGNLGKAKELLEKSIDNFPYDSEAKKMLAEVDLKIARREDSKK